MSNSGQGIWDAVEKLLQEGKSPRVTIAPSAEQKPPRRGPGRPRFRDPENPFQHYATPRKGYAHPRCLQCRKKLRKKQIEVCSDACREKAEAWLTKKMARLRGESGVRIPITSAAAKYLRAADRQT